MTEALRCRLFGASPSGTSKQLSLYEIQSASERMRRKTRTKKGRTVYARRKHVVEPVFGFIKQGLGFRQFLLRGLEKVAAEWELVNLGYNLRRLHASGRMQLAGAQ